MPTTIYNFLNTSKIEFTKSNKISAERCFESYKNYIPISQMDVTITSFEADVIILLNVLWTRKLRKKVSYHYILSWNRNMLLCY